MHWLAHDDNHAIVYEVDQQKRLIKAFTRQVTEKDLRLPRMDMSIC